MSDFNEVKKNLIEPQARTFLLAPTKMDPKVVPRKPNGDLTMLINLSQKGAGGNGDWEAYRAAFEEYITTDKDTLRRMKGDETTRKLMEKLLENYKKTGMKTKGKFFDDDDYGLQDFILKYLHYVLFGLDPFDSALMKELDDLHYDRKSAAYYLKTINKLIACRYGSFSERAERVAKVYEESPSLSKFERGEKYNGLTREDLAELSVAMMAIAGMVGPRTLLQIVLGYTKLPPYTGEDTGKIDVTKVWDQINLDDRDEVKRYIYECARLRHPVSNTHTLAASDFTVQIDNKDVTFKKGTVIFIPMQLASLDEGVYGDSAFKFDHSRENLLNFSTIWNSFGEETNGRVCPGKKIAENMVIDIVIALGKCRRNADQPLPVVNESAVEETSEEAAPADETPAYEHTSDSEYSI